MRKTLLTTALVTAAMPIAFANKAPAAPTPAGVPTPDPAAANPAATTTEAATTETAKTKNERVAPVLTSAFKIDLPARSSKRGSVSAYPFHTLTEIGTAFGLKNKTAAQLSSIVSNANRKALEPVKDEAGNTLYETKELTDPNTGAKTAVPDTSKPRTKATKHFIAIEVTDEIAEKLKGTPLEGSTALVQRDA